MQIFKKAITPFFLTLMMVFVISYVVMYPYLNSHLDYDQDEINREQLAGSIDFLVVGASHAKCSISPEILDRELNCCSYNLSTTLMPMSARYKILEKELSRNPVETVFIEISYDCLQRNVSDDEGWGESIMFSRLGTWSERFEYMIRYVGVDQWLDVLCRCMNGGLTAWKYLIFEGAVPDNVNYPAKGYYEKEHHDVSESADDFMTLYHSKDCMTGFIEDNVTLLEDMIDLCNAHHTEVIIGIVPCAEEYLYQYSDLDDFDVWLEAFAVKANCAFYNFNLMKERMEILDDAKSFSDGTHLNGEGAKAFTKSYSHMIDQISKGVDISDEFYKDYDEMMEHSAYRDCIQNS